MNSDIVDALLRTNLICITWNFNYWKFYLVITFLKSLHFPMNIDFKSRYRNRTHVSRLLSNNGTMAWNPSHSLD